MGSRNNLILLIVAAALVGFVWLGGNPFARRVGTEVKREAIFPDLDRANATDIVVEKAAMRIELHKQGDQWQLKNRQDHPANPDKINDVFDKLELFVSEHMASSSPESHARYGVDDASATLVTVLDASGKELVNARIGNSAGLPEDLVRQITQQKIPGIDTDKKAHTYFRRAGTNEVWVARTNVLGTFDTQVDQWLDRRVIHAELAEAATLDVRHGDTTTSLVRDGDNGTPEDAYDDPWFVAGDVRLPAMCNVATSMASRVASASISSLVDEAPADAGFDQPTLTATLTTKDGTRHTLVFGRIKDATAANKEYFVQVEGRPFTYLMSDYAWKDLSKPLQEILDLDLATYRVGTTSSCSRIEIIDHTDAGDVSYVASKDGDAWDAAWRAEAPAGHETTKEALDLVLGSISSSSEKKALGYVTDGSTWQPGPGSRTYKLRPMSYDGKPVADEIVTFDAPANAKDGRLRVRVDGRTPDLWVNPNDFVTVIEGPIAGWIWPKGSAAPPAEAPAEGAETPATETPATETPPSETPATPEATPVAPQAPAEEPAPTEPAPTEPAPTEPAPTEPEPTEPAPEAPEAPAEPAAPQPGGGG